MFTNVMSTQRFIDKIQNKEYPINQLNIKRLIQARIKENSKINPTQRSNETKKTRN